MNSTQEEHSTMVRQLVKPGTQIILDLKPQTAHLLHMVVGLSGEVGELLDTIKKIAIYAKPPTLELSQNIVEELGDIEFYLEGLRASLGIDRDAVLQANVTKLRSRYPAGNYSNQQAQDRADKEPQHATR